MKISNLLRIKRKSVNMKTDAKEININLRLCVIRPCLYLMGNLINILWVNYR